ncbi:hypothetical protein [Paenibacillus odorifer]|uniref:Uncharacterized protein n=1 Tax=Paenibacillus odorifer TaxID=189426 RepID=A0A1R0XKM9_9BACL|nr:hypothetical protein [Paenibacillus odorifer]OMD35655.1 hypothetical protein BSK52_26510 [Paenibacillus odorifer]
MIKRIIFIISIFVAIGSYLLCSEITAAAVQPTAKPSAITQRSASTAVPNNHTAGTTTLEVNAVVPTDFTRTILVNLNPVNSKTAENVMIRLESINGYLYSMAVKPGVYTMDFINIIGDDASAYDITASDRFTISEGETTRFKLQVAYAPKLYTSALPAEEATEKATEKAVGEKELQHILNNPVVPSEPEPESGSYVMNQSISPMARNERTTNLQEQTTLLPQSAQTVEKRNNAEELRLLLLIFPVLLLGLLVFLYKQIQYKHDYYDC